LMQEVHLEEAREALQESLAAARARQADYEIGLTLRAMVDLSRLAAEPIDIEAAAESEAILDRLGVVAVPDVPLPVDAVVPIPEAAPVAP
jgi:hypothetical protein